MDLSKIPYKELASELARRNAARRKPNQMGGRPPKMSTCPECGKAFSARDMRKHKC